MWNHKLHSVAAPVENSFSLLCPQSRRKVLCKKRGGRKEYVTIICLWQVMFYLKLHCTQRAQSGKRCNLTAELLQHMHEHPRRLLQLPLDPRDPWIWRHLPLSHIKFSITCAGACTPGCAYEAFDTNAGARLCHSSLNLDLLLFSLAVTLFVSLSLFPSHSFPLILSQSWLNVCPLSPKRLSYALSPKQVMGKELNWSVYRLALDFPHPWRRN